MVRGRRKDVDDAAAHRELAAPVHHVDAAVGEIRQPGEHTVEVVLVADPQPHGCDLPQAAHHRLDQRAHGGDHHPHRL